MMGVIATVTARALGSSRWASVVGQIAKLAGFISRPLVHPDVRAFAALIAVCGATVGDAHAQGSYAIPVVANGQPQTISIPPLPAGQTVTLYFSDVGNQTHGIDFELAGPAGLVFDLAQANYYAFLEHALYFEHDPYFWTFHWPYDQATGQTAPSLVIPNYYGGGDTPSDVPPGGGADDDTIAQLCNDIPLDVATVLITLCSDQTGHQCTRIEACRMFMARQSGERAANPALMSTHATGSVNFSSVILKDSCDPDKNRNYFIRIRLNSNGLDPALVASGYQVTLKTTVRQYKGSKAFAVKPKGEGRVKGTLFLAHTTNQYNERARLDLWDGGTISYATALKIEDYVGHRGQTLARIAANRVLFRRRGSFTIGTPTDAYSTCVKLEKSRQNLNGYKQ